MVQKKAPNIKPHLVINLRPSSPSSTQTQEKMKKIMKKPRPIKRSDESRASPVVKKSKTTSLLRDNKPVSTPRKQSPNYMRSTSSFEARKEQQSPKTPATKGGSRPSSSKMVRSLTKTPSFKPLRSSKKVILDAQRATCSSTLKESKFPNYLQLDQGGTELDGLSTMKVCPYTYCSLNGHHHAPVPPLKCFLAARRRALKAQKAKKPDVTSGPEENIELLVDNHSKNGGGKGGDDWEEGYGSDNFKLQEFDQIVKDEHQELYDEKSVSSGAWSEEDGDSASDGSCEQINQDYLNYDLLEALSAATIAETDEGHGEKLPTGDQNTEYKKEQTDDGADKNRVTIIYNIIQYNISVFVSGEKPENSEETDKTVAMKAPVTSVDANKLETEEAREVNQIVANEEVPFNAQEIENQDNHEEHHEYDAYTESNLMDEEDAIISDEDETHGADEVTDMKTTSYCKKSASNDELPDACINLRDLTGSKRPSEEIGKDNAREFNPRGPIFLAETPEPDAETVDLRHQTIDERKNAEEWMVDFALQQALAPARKRKVALLVEAFEKVVPDPIRVYETRNRHTSKAFTNSRPMQACS